jgi:acyl-coenzyme A synthetase/AMP-(fatty) acid ligase
MYVGIPYAPISPAYSLISTDFGRLRSIIDLITPGLVFAADGDGYARAIEAAVRPEIEIVVTRNPIPGRRTTLFETLLAPTPTDAAEAAHGSVSPDTIAKFLFTSGSTGTPKAVINTQRMWCSNQAMILSQLAFFADEPPVIVDWSPWHHTAGGNHNFGFVLYNGGTLYIDEGKPTPGAIETTVKNLREIATNWYFTVPKGYEALLPYFRSAAAHVLQPAQSAVVRRRGAVAVGVRRNAGARARDLRGAHHVSDRARLDRKRAHGDRADMAEQGFDQHGGAGAGGGAQARSERGQARGAVARAQHHAGLLAPA